MAIFSYGPSGASTTDVSRCEFIPGAYESVTAPDPISEWNPRYFLNQNNDRNWTYMYRGRETLQGSVPNVILLDGSPLSLILGAARHKTVAISGTIPAHNQHLIYESATPTLMDWFIQLRDSDNTIANDFNRLYLGGILNRGTISANEGEVLRMSWDDVLFSDMRHNQTMSIGGASDSTTAVSGGVARSSSFTRAMIPKAPNAASSVVGEEITYPIGDPYYFSQGVVKFFGIEFARVRSFRIEVNNNAEPRYYINNNTEGRGPNEFQFQNRQISMSVTMAMADTLSSTATTRNLWKEFILQGNYAAKTAAPLLQGFDIELTFEKGDRDSISIVSPYAGSSTIGDATDVDDKDDLIAAPTTGFGGQGCFFRRTSHNIGTESPIQVEGDIIMRNIACLVTDSKAASSYPINTGIFL